MHSRTSLRIARTPEAYPPVGRPIRPDSSEAKTREIYKGLVVASLDAGFLRYSRRQELLQLASRLGIGEFEACLLIAEAQFHSGEIDPIELAETSLEPNPLPARISISTRIALALATATFVDVLIVYWLL